jgi:hypothetical protein
MSSKVNQKEVGRSMEGGPEGGGCIIAGTRLLDIYKDKVSFDLQDILLEFDYLP